MNLDNIRQFKLASGEEVIVEVIEWDNQEDAAIIIRNAFEIHFLSSPTGAMRLCTLRPFMIGQIDKIEKELNSENIVPFPKIDKSKLH